MKLRVLYFLRLLDFLFVFLISSWSVFIAKFSLELETGSVLLTTFVFVFGSICECLRFFFNAFQFLIRKKDQKAFKLPESAEFEASGAGAGA